MKKGDLIYSHDLESVALVVGIHNHVQPPVLEVFCDGLHFVSSDDVEIRSEASEEENNEE